MKRPRSRRSLLASISAAAAAVTTGGLAGPATDRSLASGVVPADRYDRRDAVRPDPPDDAALEPGSYPSNRTPPLSVTTGVIRYVTDFERAYRRNAFLVRYGPAARSFELRRTGRRAAAVDPAASVDAVLVAIVYDLTARTRYGAEDEWGTRVTYYVDANVVLRARYDGVAADPAFEPDPRTNGAPVAVIRP
jgi:hypothetical protein